MNKKRSAIITEDSLLKEIAHVMHGVCEGLEVAIFGDGTVRTLFGLPGGDDSAWREGADLYNVPVPEAMNAFYEAMLLPSRIDQKLNVSGLPATFNMRALYDYAANARWPRGLEVDRFLADAHVFCSLGRICCELYGSSEGPSQCEAILERATARAKLDAALGKIEEITAPRAWHQAPHILTLRDIALLATMSEKAVRNATFESDDKALRIKRQGGRIYVEPQEALRWLRGRRGGFKETELYELEASGKKKDIQEIFAHRIFE